MSADLGKKPTPKGSAVLKATRSLRQRIIRVARIDGKHHFVLFGRALEKLSPNSRYLRLRDREFELYTQLKRVSGKTKTSTDAATGTTYYLKPDRPERLPLDELCDKLAAYDVISFDIFDTALYRAVDKPNDVFRLMGARVGMDNFSRVRKAAERHARVTNARLRDSREVTLEEIYAVMVERYGADPTWMAIECELEIELSRPNPYIKEAFDRLRALGKRIIFTSDMYLPMSTIEQMLIRNGYYGYEKIYLSNETLLRKGDGGLQRLILADYGESASVVHVGDVFESDVERSLEVGMPALHNPDARVTVEEPATDSMAGSFYRAVVNNALGSGTWTAGLHYTHGFRVGGILTVGYCEFIERLVRDKAIDRVLFCGRDCDVISRVYRKHYGSADSSYIEISRYAVTGITLDRNFDDYIGRSFFRWFSDSNNTKPLFQLLADTGFDYLIDELANADIEKYLFPSGANRRKLEEFFWDHRHVIEEHNRASVEAAKQYFSCAIGGAKRILIVDVGWSGTCIYGLRHFFRTALSEHPVEVFGALMCTSRNEQVNDAVSEGIISSYIYSPQSNMDLTRFMMPGGRQSVRTTDLLHLPLEYLFTSPVPTCVGYAFDGAGNAVPLRGNNMPENVEQIQQIQQGIVDFAEAYLSYSRGFADLRPVSPYVAFQPLKSAISHQEYVAEVYKDFLYDAAPALFGERTHWERFGDLFATEGTPSAALPVADVPKSARRILFVSPEMVYAGAPRSLLRMCKVAISLGFEPVVWSAKSGPFIKEFEAIGLRVHVTPDADVTPERVRALIQSGVELAVCNTVVTDAYVRRLEKFLPVVWYVREASNLPDFFRSNPERLATLQRSGSICCVSDYAKAAIAAFTDQPIDVVPNSVEDVSELALPYQPRKDGVHRFVQLGTIEQRKGYDLIVAAYKSLPEEYRQRAEIHFAGGFINSGTSFASYLFGQINGVPGIHYHGLISDERQKIELLSQMDTVVVASRDESFSLVALEGAMLSKPLILTQNVGAKYLIGDENGLVIESGSVRALRDAFMQMIDKDEPALLAMGTASRKRYDELASMDAYRRDLSALFERKIAAGVAGNRGRRAVVPTQRAAATSGATVRKRSRSAKLIVSMTSFPARMRTIVPCVDSLLAQTKKPDKLILWLSTEQFPDREDSLPEELRSRVGDRFGIEWVDDDLKSHKKYFYAAARYPDDLLVTVDDDVVYNETVLENLYAGHLESPHCIIAERANMVLFRPDGNLREYDTWIYDCQHLRATQTYQLLPTGVGGVLYPPGSIPAAAFDVSAIKQTSLTADDLWLKVMTTANGYPVWMPRRRAGHTQIQDAQAVGLWRANSFQGGNDAALRRVLDYYGATLGSTDTLLRRIWGVGRNGEFLGPSELDLSPLI